MVSSAPKLGGSRVGSQKRPLIADKIAGQRGSDAGMARIVDTNT